MIRLNLAKPKKVRSLKALSNQAWDLMSKWIRQNESDEHGNCRCVSCGWYGSWKEFDAGHFVHAGHGGKQNPVSYDPRNIHPQCPQCNRQTTSKHRHPTMVTVRYTAFMITKYGPGIIDQLEAIKKQPWFRFQELEEQICLLKERL